MAVTLASATGSSPCFNTGIALVIVAKMESFIFTGATTGVTTNVYTESSVGLTGTVSFHSNTSAINDEINTESLVIGSTNALPSHTYFVIVSCSYALGYTMCSEETSKLPDVVTCIYNQSVLCLLY